MVGYLRKYPERQTAELSEEGFLSGIKIPSVVSSSGAVCVNLRSAREHPDVVREKLYKEVRLGRMLGPFLSPPLLNMMVSPLELVPKKGGKHILPHPSFMFSKRGVEVMIG